VQGRNFLASATSILTMRMRRAALCLDREVDNCATDLDCFVVPRQERCSLLDQDERAEFGLVVLEHELSIFELNFCVAARD